MKEFLVTNGFIILIVIGIVGYIGYLLLNRRWTRLREIAYKLIKQAEKTITGTKKGQERFELVLNQLYNMIPAWLRFFIPRSLMEEKLQEWFNLIKDTLDYGKINKPPDGV